MSDSFILGLAVPGEAFFETMVELCLWPSILLLRKLEIYCNYIWYILHALDFYVLGLRYMEKNIKPTVSGTSLG
jgi:hypothetical protein